MTKAITLSATVVLIMGLIMGLMSLMVSGINSSAEARSRPANVVKCPAEGRCEGTPAADTLKSGAGASQIYALAGPDYALGTGKGEGIFMGRGDDTAIGRGGGDVIDGGSGDDDLDGGPGHDAVGGGPGKDTLVGGSGQDRMFAAESLGERPGANAQDEIDAGGGRDICVVSKRDQHKGCETVQSAKEYRESVPGSQQ
jgi:Ca2+-binding RTX toxin-like protein